MPLHPPNEVPRRDPPVGRQAKGRDLGDDGGEPRGELPVGEGVVVLYGGEGDAEGQEEEGGYEAGAVLA